MLILGAANRSGEVSEVLPFCESGQLRNVVQSNVENALNAGLSQSLEEVLGRTLCKTDCGDLHVDSPSNPS